MRLCWISPLALLLVAFSGCHINARGPFRQKIRFHDNLNYGDKNDAHTEFDLYLPANAAGKVPVAIFIHGGFWRNQSRSYYQWFTGLYENFGLALASRGIATAVIDYHTYPKGSIETQYADIAAAVNFLQSNAATYGIDAQRLCLVGHSAGAHLALMHAWRKNIGIACVVALSPIVDIAHMRKSSSADFNRDTTTPVFGNGEHDHMHSPIAYAQAAKVRTLVLYGENDYDFLVERATAWQKELTPMAAPITLQWANGLSHADMVLKVNKNNDPLGDRMAQFIRQAVQGQ